MHSPIYLGVTYESKHLTVPDHYAFIRISIYSHILMHAFAHYAGESSSLLPTNTHSFNQELMHVFTSISRSVTRKHAAQGFRLWRTYSYIHFFAYTSYIYPHISRCVTRQHAAHGFRLWCIYSYIHFSAYIYPHLYLGALRDSTQLTASS